MGPDELFQRALVARRYFLDGRTRIQIAEELGISRFRVARMLDEALTSGMVEITIHDPGSLNVELSSALKDRYGLEHAYVVVTGSTELADRVEAVARATSELMTSILREGDIIGVDSGRTLSRISGHLTTLPRCEVVQLTGMAGAITANGADLVRRLSELTGGPSWPLYVPLVVPDARTAASLTGNRHVQATLEQQRKVSCAVVSVGAWVDGQSQVFEALTAEETDHLSAAGVCAETCALLLDADGRRIPGLDDRRMGVAETTLRTIPTVIAVSCGPDKIEATRAVLRSGLVSSLVTDNEIATAILDRRESDPLAPVRRKQP